MANNSNSRIAEEGFDKIAKSLDNLANKSSQSGISLDALVKALKEATGVAGGANFQTLADQMERMNTAVNSVNTSLSKMAKNKPNIEAITKAVNGLKSFEFRTSGSKKMQGGIQQLNKDLSTTAARVSKVITKLESMSKWLTKINSGGGFNVKINNKGFANVISAMTEMNKAITNFHNRKGNNRKNFFEVAFGTRESNSKAANKMVDDAKHTVEEIKSAFGNSFSESLSSKLSKSIKEGIKKGVEEGITSVQVSKTSDFTNFLKEFSSAVNLSQYQKGDMFQAIARMNGAPIDPWLIKNQKMKSNDYRYKIRQELQTKENIKRFNKTAELDMLYNTNPEEIKRAARAVAEKYETELKAAIAKYEALAKREKEGRKARENYYKDIERIQKEFEQYQGRELGNYDKARMKMGYLVEKWEELRKRAENNKYDQSQLYQLTRQITEQTRKMAVEAYKASKGYDQIKKSADRVHKTLSSLASVFQRISAGVGSAGQIFSTLRSQATTLFGYLRNSVRALTAQLRGQLSSALNDGINQFKSMEAAKISFDQFFGKERSDEVISEVRYQALQTPIVTSGELADYVSQLAPVSNGNASLAINASLGALKAIAASGSSTADMEYVIKNIRDVISKGKATAIDIRQFNRAMPALEKFIEKMGLTEFLTDEGEQKNLNITEENVGKVLDMFAHLNTDEDSPIKNINEQQLTTLQGMLQLMKERKTTMVESVLKNSGAFDLAKKVLGVASGEGIWGKLERFFTKHLKNVIDFLNNVPWDQIGKKLQEGMKRVSNAVKSAYDDVVNTLKEVIGVDNAMEAFDVLWGIIEDFINGFKEGVNGAIRAYDTLKNMIGEDAVKTLATSIGFLVSPMGKIINTMLSLTRDFTAGISRVFATMDSITKWNYNRKLQNIEKAAGKYADLVTSVGIDGARRLYNADGSPIRFFGKDTIIQGTTMYKAGQAPVTLKNSDGQVTMYKYLTGKEKRSYVGKWGYVKGGLQSVASGFVKAASVVTSALSALGAAFIASNIIDGITSAGKSMKFLGDNTEWVMNTFNVLAKTISGAVIGSMVGGPYGGLIGAIGMATIALVKLKIAADEEAKREQEKKIEEIEGRERKAIYNAVMTALKERGVNTDTGSDEGQYADQKLRQYLNSVNPASIDYQKAADTFANALLYKQVAEGIVAYTSTDEFKNAGGRALDWDKDIEYRDKLAEMISWHRINGDDYNYDNSSETIVNDFFNGDVITEEQAKLLINKWGVLDKDINKETTELSQNISALVSNSNALGDNTSEIKKLNEYLAEQNNEKNNVKNEYQEKNKGLGGLFKLFTGTLEGESMGFTKGKIDGKRVSIDNLHDALTDKRNELLNDLKSPDLTPEKKTELQKELAQVLTDIHMYAPKDGDVSALESDVLKSLTSKYGWLIEYLRKYISAAQGGMIDMYKIASAHKTMKPVYRASGGTARGVDVVPAMLQPGEFVVRKDSVKRIGLGALTAINRGDLISAARNLGNRFNNSYNNSRNWSNVVNNNQRTATNNIKIFNRTPGARANSYYGLANRVALS